MSTEKVSGGEVVIGPVTEEIMGPEPSNVRGLIEEKVKEMSEGSTHEPRGVRKLGRSFGLVPADRGLTDRGLYGWVRHPMYTGELCFFLGIVLENPMARNWVIVSALFIGLPLRALAEERFLLSDPRYQSYMARVRRRFLPKTL